MNILFLILVVAALGAVEAVYHWARYVGARRDEKLRHRLRALGTDEGHIGVIRRRRLSKTGDLDSLIGESDSALRIEQLLEQTDLSWTVLSFFGYSLACLLVGTVLFSLLFRTIGVGVAFGCLCGSLPLLYLLAARSRRRVRISDQLPDALDMLARSLRAGHALNSAFKLVAQEMPPPIAIEFAKAFEQQNLGIPFERSVVAMTERVPSNQDLLIFSVSVLVQRETGGNLVEMLEKIADTIRQRYRFFSKLRALTAEGRIGAIILGSLPIVVFWLLVLVNRDYVSELFQGTGFMILAYGIGSWFVGMIWMYRISKVDY